MSGTDRFFDCDCDDEIVGVLKGVAAAPHAPNAAFVQSVHTVEFDVEMPVDMQAMHGFGDSLPRSSSPSVQEPSFLASLAPAPSFSSPTSSQSRQMEPSSVHTDAHGDSMALPPLKLHTSVTTSVAGGNASAAVAQASSLTVAPCFGMAKPSAPIVPATNPLFSFEPRPQSEPLNNRVGRLTGTFRDNYFVWKPSATPTPSQAHPRAYDDDTATGSQPLQISSQQSVTMSQQSQISIVESSLVRSFSLPPSQSPQSQPSSSSSPVQMGSAVSASWNTSNVPFSWDLIDPAELQCPGPVPDNVALRKVDPMGVQSMRDFPECCLNTHEAFDPACGFSSFLNPMNVYVGARTSKAHDAGPVPDSFVKAHVMHFLVHIEEQGFTQRWELRASRVRAFTEGGETNGIIADQSAFRYARRPDVYCVQIKWASCAKNFHLQMELFFRGAGKTEMTLVLRSKPDLPFKVNSIASVVQKVYRRDQMSVSATNSPVKREHPPQRHYNSSGGTFRTDLEENDEEVALLTRSIPQTPVSATAGGFRTLTIATPSPSGSKRSRSQTDGRSQSAVGFLQSSYTSQMRSQTQVDVSDVPEQYEGHAFTSHDDVPELSPVQIDQVLVAEDAQPGSQPQLLVLHQRTVQPFTTPLVARKLGQSTPGYGLTPASETSTNLSLHDIPVDHLVFADEETFS